MEFYKDLNQDPAELRTAHESISPMVHFGQHQPPSLPAEVEAELERIVRRYLGADFHFDP